MAIPFGVSTYLGRYGNGKTYHTFGWIYDYIFNEINDPSQQPFIISNIPYNIVDIFFSSPDEIQSIVQFLNDYIRHTNNDHKTYYDYYESQRPIYVIIDEAHIYFHARNFANGKFTELLQPLSQCRKRKIKFIIITQFARQIDVGLRTTSDFAVSIDKFNLFGADFTKIRTYMNPGDVLDLDVTSLSLAMVGDQTKKDYVSQYLFDSSYFREKTFFLNLLVKYRRAYHYLASEIHNTVYVTGFSDHSRALPKMSCYFTTDQYKNFYNSIFNGSPPNIPYPPDLGLDGPNPDLDSQTTQSTFRSRKVNDYKPKSNTLPTWKVSPPIESIIEISPT